jgi:hypothetical protein
LTFVPPPSRYLGTNILAGELLALASKRVGNETLFEKIHAPLGAFRSNLLILSTKFVRATTGKTIGN